MSTEEALAGEFSTTEVTSWKTSIDEVIDPYFLHHTDFPGMILVTQEMNDENYHSWSRSMMMALQIKNKLGFIHGSISKPEGSKLNHLNSWRRNNTIVIAWILNSCTKEIASSMTYRDSVVDIWKDLQERFQQSNGPRIFFAQA